MNPIPYGRQTITGDDIDAVIEVLRSDWLTTGPAVEKFEAELSHFVGAQHGVAVSSGTAALHAAMHALAVGAGDEVIVPAITFAATSNAVIYCGAKPVFADVQPGTLLIDPRSVRDKITSRTRGIIAVDYAGQPCDYTELREIASKHSLWIVADACHALGATYKDAPLGQVADVSAFSFHPVKHITTGEGGMATTNDPALATRMRIFRNHGITSDHRQRAKQGSFFYEMTELGFNYRLSDLQCALGVSQLRKLPNWLERRSAIAKAYDEAFSRKRSIQPLLTLPDRTHAYHLYVVQLDDSAGSPPRNEVFDRLRQDGILCNVHYLPVYLHPYYRDRYNYTEGLCPVAEAAYSRILSLPIFPLLQDDDVASVIRSLEQAVCRQGF